VGFQSTPMRVACGRTSFNISSSLASSLAIKRHELHIGSALDHAPNEGKIAARGAQSGPVRHVLVAAIDRENGRRRPYLARRPCCYIRRLVELSRARASSRLIACADGAAIPSIQRRKVRPATPSTAEAGKSPRSP
jgi:hypothetical protein